MKFKYYNSLILLLVFLTTGILQSQSYSFFYELVFKPSYASPFVNYFELKIDLHNAKTVFSTVSKDKLLSEEKSKTLSESNDFDYSSNVFVVIPRNNKKILLTDFQNDSLYYQDAIRGSTFVLMEKIPKIKWKITKEQMVFQDSVRLTKATVSFRGRDWIAWFNPKIAIPYGPFKFHGLPGAIYQLYDSSETYRWTLRTIRPVNEPITFDPKKLVGERVDLREYVKIYYAPVPLVKEHYPNGVNSRPIVTTELKEMPREGIEILFEWEVPPTQKSSKK